MSLQFKGPRGKRGQEIVHSLVCTTCHDPETKYLDLIILYTANRITDPDKVRELAVLHERLLGNKGKRHKLVAQRENWATSMAREQVEARLTTTEELAPGHPNYENQQTEKARHCPLRKN